MDLKYMKKNVKLSMNLFSMLAKPLSTILLSRQDLSYIHNYVFTLSAKCFPSAHHWSLNFLMVIYICFWYKVEANYHNNHGETSVPYKGRFQLRKAAHFPDIVASKQDTQPLLPTQQFNKSWLKCAVLYDFVSAVTKCG